MYFPDYRDGDVESFEDLGQCVLASIWLKTRHSPKEVKTTPDDGWTRQRSESFDNMQLELQSDRRDEVTYRSERDKYINTLRPIPP